MGLCLECGKECQGVLLKEGEEFLFIPTLCEACLQKISTDNFDPEKDALTCPKCKKNVPILRDRECIDCYLTRCDDVIKLPMETNEVDPPLGWLYPAQELVVMLEYDGIRSRNHKMMEC